MKLIRTVLFLTLAGLSAAAFMAVTVAPAGATVSKPSTGKGGGEGKSGQGDKNGGGVNK